jgi:hypothetical protein
MTGSLGQLVLIKSRKDRGGEWSHHDYDVRDSLGKVVGSIMRHPKDRLYFGTSPIQAEKSRPDRNTFGSAMLATSAVAST